ncbi:RHS domain-containing protein, partial [Xenorhabdus bovienii]|uniref:RHS repeat-associated core domain-containing protein n=1 Tax=Xenorhabdus bovienii TaxID=40576 RepID=UPI00301C6629
YIVSDHQGTPREMLSEEGVLVWAQRLTTWGKAEKSQVIASNNPDYHVNCNLRFMGQYEDEESGLYYNRFRYYHPQTGQYLSPDPIGLAGGFNPYSYVHNPTNFIDPYGLAGKDCDKSIKDSYDKARNKALEWLEERGFKAEKVNTGKFGSTKNQPVGMTTADGKTGFRIEFDERSGAHINVFSGKDKGDHFLFDATEKTVTKLQKIFNHPSKPRRGS